MAARDKSTTEKLLDGRAGKALRNPLVAAAAGGLAATGIGALLRRWRNRKETPDKPTPRRDANGEVTFVDDGIQGY